MVGYHRFNIYALGCSVRQIRYSPRIKAIEHLNRLLKSLSDD
jgi:hypothetical protein